MTETRLRTFMAALLFIGFTGTETELLLLHHYEDSWQLAPLALGAVSIFVLIWHRVARSPASVRVFQGVMALCLAAGAAGVLFHYQANVEFQTEVEPGLAGWRLFTGAIQAKVPPALAPGVMAQLGLLGLAYTYRHPATSPKPSGVAQ